MYYTLKEESPCVCVPIYNIVNLHNRRILRVTKLTAHEMNIDNADIFVRMCWTNPFSVQKYYLNKLYLKCDLCTRILYVTCNSCIVYIVVIIV